MNFNSDFDLKKAKSFLLNEGKEDYGINALTGEPLPKPDPIVEEEVERLGIFGDIDNEILNGGGTDEENIDYLNSIIDYCNKEINSIQLYNSDEIDYNDENFSDPFIDGDLDEGALNEMAKIAGDLKSSIESVISANPELQGLALKKAIKGDAAVINALDGEDLYDNQLNKFIALTRGERELGQRGRKADPNKPAAEPKAKAEKPAKEKSPKLRITDPTAGEKPVSSTFIDGEDEEEMEMDKQAAKAAKGSKEFADEVAPDKTEKFNLGLKFVTKYKDDRNLIDAYLKKAKDEYKLSANMIKDLKRAAGRQVEA